MDDSNPEYKNLVFSISCKLKDAVAAKRFLLEQGISLHGLFLYFVRLIAEKDHRIIELIEDAVGSKKLEASAKKTKSPLLYVSAKSIYQALNQNDPLKERTGP